MRALNTHTQLELIDEFGRFGLLAHRVGGLGFTIETFRHNESTVIGMRVPEELQIRLEALASVAGITQGRMVYEVVKHAVDELESEMISEAPEAYSRYINLYEAIVQHRLEQEAFGQ